MSKTTPATVALSQAGVAFSLHPYAYDADAPRTGLQAAEALGWPPEQVFKTLMTLVDGAACCWRSRPRMRVARPTPCWPI